MNEKNPIYEILKISEADLKMAPLLNQGLLLTIIHFQIDSVRRERGWFYRLRNKRAVTEKEFTEKLDEKYIQLLEKLEKTI